MINSEPIQNNEILVSIRCLTYNHAPFIRQCLDGFVMQKTNFRFEAIVHDDASTDESASIIREYAEKYPDIIKPILETENQYSKHDGSLGRIINSHMRGKYVAMCEGDDYWTDPYKLQKQVDFLESHPDYVMCSHRNNTYFDGQGKMLVCEDQSEVVYSLNDLIRGQWYFHPLTVVYRRCCYDAGEYALYPVSMDAVLFFHLLKKGKGICLADNMAVYRIHDGGVWSKVGLDKQSLQEFRARLGIYQVEKSREAALFLLSLYAKALSRGWMYKNKRMIMQSFRIFNRHFGFIKTLKIFFDKVLMNRLVNLNDFV